MSIPRIFVTGTRFRITEHPGYLKAHLNGWMGWTSVWATTGEALVRRIKQIRSGGQ
jgi:hypothetical protein